MVQSLLLLAVLVDKVGVLIVYLIVIGAHNLGFPIDFFLLL